MRRTFIILSMLATLAVTPALANEQAEKDGIEADMTPVAITVSGTQVHVTGAEGKLLEIYNLAGVRVAVVKIDSDDKTLSLNLPKGCYILRTDNVARKISIR